MRGREARLPVAPQGDGAAARRRARRTRLTDPAGAAGLVTGRGQIAATGAPESSVNAGLCDRDDEMPATTDGNCDDHATKVRATGARRQADRLHAHPTSASVTNTSIVIASSTAAKWTVSSVRARP